MFTISYCKKILGEVSKNMADSEIESLRDTFVVLSDLAIDSYLAKRKWKSDEQKYENRISKP